jgi:DNA-binding transcriptional regulator YiaG
MTGQDVTKFRARLKLTPQELAEKLGVHRITVQRWENGVVPVPQTVAMAIKWLARKVA